MHSITNSRLSTLLPFPSISVLPSMDRLKGVVAESFSSIKENLSYYCGTTETTPLLPSLEGRVSLAPSSSVKQEGSLRQPLGTKLPYPVISAGDRTASNVPLRIDLPADPTDPSSKRIRYIIDLRVAQDQGLPAQEKTEATPQKNWLSIIKSIFQIFFIIIFLAHRDDSNS